MTNQFGRAIARTSRREREGIRGHRGGRKRVRSRPVVRSEAALAIYICRQHNKPHYRFWDLGLKGQALRQIRAPSELAPWVQARGWREIAFFRCRKLTHTRAQPGLNGPTPDNGSMPDTPLGAPAKHPLPQSVALATERTHGSPRQEKDGIACKTNALPHQTQGRTSPLIA